MAAAGPLWGKAPTALLRYPGLLGAVTLGALLVALVAAAYPIFLSRSEGQLLASQIAGPTVTRYGAGVFYGVTNVRFGERAYVGSGTQLERLDEAFAKLAAAGPHLGRPIRYALGPTDEVTLPGGVRGESGPIEGRLVSGTGAERQVNVVAGDVDGDGVVMPDLIADVLGVGPGDDVEFGGSLRLRITAVYRSLYNQPRLGYWLPWSEQLYRQCADCSAPPQFILLPRDRLEAITRSLRQDADFGWEAPLEGLPLTVDEAREVRDYAERLLFQVTHRRTEMGKLFACCGLDYVHGSFFRGRRDTEFRSSMRLVIPEVERRTAAVDGPLRLLLIAGLGVAGAVVAAAAAFAVAGRRTEAALLHARGWGPSRFAVKSVVESFLPTLVGATVGLALGWWLVTTFGPAAPAAASASRASLEAAAAAGAAALLLLGLVSALSFIRTFEVHALRGRLAWVPWEVLAIAVSLWILARLRGGGALVEDPRLDIQRPSALLLAFPVLFVAGFATLAARLVVAAARRWAPRLGASPASYLAVHRLTSLPGLTVLLVGATALCLGVFVNGQTLVRSLRATADAKAGVFVGSDVQVRIDFDAPEQGSFPLPLTRATWLTSAGRIQPGDVPFDILGVDAETVADAAFWDPSFADDPIKDLAARLRSGGEGPLPAILVQWGGAVTEIGTAQAEIPIRVVGTAIAFPGVRSDHAAVVVDIPSLERTVDDVRGNPFFSANARTEYWIRGPTDRALAAVADLEAFPLATLTAEEVKDVPFIKAAIETFSMLNLLGLAAALLVVGVVVVYLQARQRARTVSEVLSRRMGMRRGQAMAALIEELAALLLVAFVLGAALGLLAGALVSTLLDPLPTIPPPPLFAMPAWILAWTVVALVVVAVLGGWLVHRRASSVSLGEVLRVAE